MYRRVLLGAITTLLLSSALPVMAQSHSETLIAAGGGDGGGGGITRGVARPDGRICCEDSVARLQMKQGRAVPPIAAKRAFDVMTQIEATEDWRLLSRVLELGEPLRYFDAATTEHHLSRLAKALTAGKKPTEAQYVAASNLNLRAAAHRLDLGDKAGADALLDREGFLREFMIVGPFENGNMLGFDVAYPPEGVFDANEPLEGKGGKVSWRPLGLSVGGYNWLSGAMNPSRSVAVYAVTTVRSSKKQKAVLRLGTQGAYKVWLNGKRVARVDTDLAGHADRDAVGIELARGDNAILIKLAGENRGDLGFYMRLTDTKGKPLALPSSARPKDGTLLASPAEDKRAFAVASPVDAARKESEGDEALMASRLAALAHMSHKLRPLDPKAPWRGDAKKAVEAAPKDVDVLLLASSVFPEHWERLLYLEAAKALDPRSPWLLYRINEEMMQGMGMGHTPEMLERTKTMVELVEGTGGAATPALLPRLQRARILQRMGQSREAARKLNALVGTYAASAPLNAQLRGLEQGLGHPHRVLALTDAMLKSVPLDPSLVEARASLHLKAAQPDKARALIEKLLPVRPDAFASGRTLAKALHQLKKDDEALAAYDKILALSPGYVPVLMDKATLLERMGRKEEAASTYDVALMVQPENRTIEERVRALRPESESYEVPWRFDIAELTPQPDAAERYAGQDYYYLASQEVVHVSPSGQASKFTQNVVHVLNEEGAKTWRTDRVYYSPGHERVDIVSVRVRKPDGSINEVYQRRDYDAGKGQGTIYYQRRFAYLDVGALEPGDVVEYAYRVNEVSQENFREGYFGDIWYFESSVGVERARYVLITPESMTIHARPPALPGLEASTGEAVVRDVKHTVRTFEAGDIGAVRTDREMPGRSESYAYVLVSTYKTWDEVGKWWWNLIKDQLVVDEEIRKVVKEVTRGVKAKRDKVRAIHNWVVKNTRYVGIEFGVHGWKPYRTTLCMRRKFGDCKDKASLIKVMLDEAGVKANLVLIRTRRLGKVVADPANLAIFNHAIAYVPEFDLFLDGTAEFSGTAELPFSDQGTMVVIVEDGGGVKVRETPVDKPEQNKHLRILEVDLRNNATIVKGKLTATGADAVWYRRKFDAGEKRKEKLERIVSRSFPGAKLLDAEFIETTDLEKSVEVEFRFEGGGFVKQVGDTQVLFPAGREIRLLDQYASQASRDQDLMLGVPYQTVERVRYTLPKDTTGVLPKGTSGESPFGSYDVTYKATGGDTIEMEVTYAFAAERVKVEDYKKFREWLGEVDRAINKPVMLKTD